MNTTSMIIDTCAPSPTLRWASHEEEESSMYRHQSPRKPSYDDDATTRPSIYAPSAGYDGEPSQHRRFTPDQQHLLISSLPEVSEAISDKIMSALVTGGKAPSRGSCRLAIVMPGHEEQRSKSSIANDFASTSAAARKRKVLEIWTRRGSRWVILKRWMLLLVLTM